MKLTSKIIIALLALPFAAVLAGAAILAIFGQKGDIAHDIEARTYTSAALEPFSEVKFVRENDIWYGEGSILEITCDSAYSIKSPAEWSDYLSTEVNDGVLTVTIAAPEDRYIRLDHGTVKISAPAVSLIDGSHGEGTISGFNQKSLALDTADDWDFADCRIDSITVEHPKLRNGYLKLAFNDSYAQQLTVKSFSRLNLFTSGTGRIDNCTWMPDSTQKHADFQTYVKEANIGAMQWIPANEKQTFNLESKQQTTITFQK